ncbi:MAG TPA: VOC family protein [Verrucomicrobiae bacterium]|nr:VOC family protein [Verrucomicrobiae bacterium]
MTVDIGQRVMPCLWFNDQAEEAARFYTSLFKNSGIKAVSRYGKAGAEQAGRPEGSVMTVIFELEGQELMALNGGPQFTFSPAISLVANCETQRELDELWEKLSAGGEKGPCGWLTDRYGVSWQIVPTFIRQVFASEDQTRQERVMQAILGMTKLDLQRLRDAWQG